MVDLGTGNNNKINWALADKLSTGVHTREEVLWFRPRIIRLNIDIDWLWLAHFYGTNLLMPRGKIINYSVQEANLAS